MTNVSPSRILVAVDDGPDADRVASYVGRMIAPHSTASVTLFHVLKPMPRVLLEHGGSENPAVEERLGRQLRRDQARWSEKEEQKECPALRNARRMLESAGVPASRIDMKFGHEEDVARNIIEEVQAGSYDTVVLGSVPSKEHLDAGHVREQVLRDCRDVAIWIVQ